MTGAAPSGPTPLFATTSALPKPTPLFPKHISIKSSNPVPLLPNPVPYQAPAPSAPSTSSSGSSKKKSKSALDPEAQRNALEKAGMPRMISYLLLTLTPFSFFLSFSRGSCSQWGSSQAKESQHEKEQEGPSKIETGRGSGVGGSNTSEWDPSE